MKQITIPILLEDVAIYNDPQGTVDVTNPATQEIIAKVPVVGEEGSKEAIEAADKSFKEWSKTSSDERSSRLRKVFEILSERSDDIAFILTSEQGKPLREAKAEIEYAAQYFLWFSEEAKRIFGKVRDIGSGKEMAVRRYPIGVCGLITPWNFPIAMLARKVAAALAAGCTVLAKPSMETPLSAIALAHVLREAEIPQGVCNILCGDGATIVSVWMDDERVRKISFTGSTETGKLLIGQSAKTVKKLTLELGGNAPCIVFSDCDLEKTLDAVIHAKFRNAGQTCISINRFIVQESIQERFVQGLIERVSRLTVGDGRDSKTDIGPLINKKAVEKVARLVSDACANKAKLAYGQSPNLQSLFVSPIVLTDVSQDMQISCEEVFGPVCAVQTFRNDDEAAEIANRSIHGLASYVFTKSYDRFRKFLPLLEYGMVGFNENNLSLVSAPFGGIKQSGFGREGGTEGIEEYQRVQYLAVGNF